MSRYTLTLPAVGDLEDVRIYFRRTNVAAGRRLMRAVTERFRHLASHPGVGRDRHEPGPGT